MASKRKLTLSIDASLVEEAEKEARRRGLSVSEMVEQYFRDLQRESPRPEARGPKVRGQEVGNQEIETRNPGRPGRDRPLPDVVQRLIGAGKSSGGVAEDEQRAEADSEQGAYFRYLEEKHK